MPEGEPSTSLGPVYATLTLVFLAVLVHRRGRGRDQLAGVRSSAWTTTTTSTLRPGGVRNGSGCRRRADLGSRGSEPLFGAGRSDATWDELEELLIKADVGPQAPPTSWRA